jgi:hypothetical protein
MRESPPGGAGHSHRSGRAGKQETTARARPSVQEGAGGRGGSAEERVGADVARSLPKEVQSSVPSAAWQGGKIDGRWIDPLRAGPPTSLWPAWDDIISDPATGLRWIWMWLREFNIRVNRLIAHDMASGRSFSRNRRSASRLIAGGTSSAPSLLRFWDSVRSQLISGSHPHSRA